MTYTKSTGTCGKSIITSMIVAVIEDCSCDAVRLSAIQHWVNHIQAVRVNDHSVTSQRLSKHKTLLQCMGFCRGCISRGGTRSSIDQLTDRSDEQSMPSWCMP